MKGLRKCSPFSNDVFNTSESYDLKHGFSEGWTLSHSLQTIVDVVCVLPGIGAFKYSDEAADFEKATGKGTKKVFGEKIAKAVDMKNAGKASSTVDEAIHAADDIVDKTDEVAEAVTDSAIKNGDEVADGAGVVDDVVEGGTYTKVYKEGFDTHLIDGKLGSGSKGVGGGHNFDSFKETLINAGFDIDDCIINVNKHPTIDGIYEIEYRIPARKYGATGELEIIPGQYKTIDYPKTVYDPAIISNEKAIEWGMEAMEEGIVSGRNIYGYASNGLKFEGYIDLETGMITNFYPVLE